MSVRLTTRRTVTALASVAALAVAASPASAKTHAAGPAAPPVAHAFKGKLTKAQEAKMRKAAKSPAGSPKLAIQGKDSVSVFCGLPYIGNWGGYTLRCHIVVVGGLYGYTDWYEYDYWNGYQWRFWFNALS